jgi:hypothetical protein
MTALSPHEILPNGHMKKGELWAAGLVVMTIDVLENLESSVKEVSLIQLLSSYSTDVPKRDVSLHN